MKHQNIISSWNIFLLTLTSTHQALHADVNLKDASFFKDWVDYTIARDRRDFKIRRQYKSRSLNNGYFGFGWCSEIEKSVRYVDKNLLEITDCLKESKATFRRSTQNNGDLFINTQTKTDQVRLSDQGYTRRRNGKIIQKFNLGGKLVYLFDKNTLPVQISYNQLKPAELQFDDGRKIKINFNKKDKIESLQMNNEVLIKYEYKNEDLTEVNTLKRTSPMPTPHYRYEYSELHNLTTIQYDNNKTEFIKYDENNDRVLSTSDPKGCIENYSYQVLPSPQQKPIFRTQLEKICSGKKFVSATYDFYYSTSNTNKNILAELRINTNGRRTNILFDDKTGLLRKIQTDNPRRAEAFEKTIQGEFNDLLNREAAEVYTN
jgi:hypothetical protein